MRAKQIRKWRTMCRKGEWGLRVPRGGLAFGAFGRPVPSLLPATSQLILGPAYDVSGRVPAFYKCDNNSLGTDHVQDIVLDISSEQNIPNFLLLWK